MNIAQMQQQFDHIHRHSREEVDGVAWEVRHKRLSALYQLVDENRDAIIRAISADFGQRSRSETLMAEIFPSLAGIKHALKHGKKWAKKRKVASGFWFMPAQSHIQPQPLGVVGIVAPWNYPLYLIVGPLTSALVAGNRAMVKVSEFSPHFAQWLAENVCRYFSEDELAIIQGEGDIAQAFSSLPFDHLLFTGSTHIGHHVMQAASANLTPVTLELGGKSPVFVGESANLAKAVNRIMVGKLLNAGQTCVAPDYVLLSEERVSDFISEAKKWLKRHYPKIAQSADYTTIINDKQFARLHSLITEAQEVGAQITPLSEAQSNADTRFFAPVLVSGLPEKARLLNEEIFGPILPLITYQNRIQAEMWIKAKPRPLAFYVFSQDNNEIDALMHNIVAGGVCINETIMHLAQENLPFGGVGASGMGAYHGKSGFDQLSHLKPVFTQSKINGVNLLSPPYGKKFNAMMKLLLKWP